MCNDFLHHTNSSNGPEDEFSMYKHVSKQTFLFVIWYI